MTRPLFDEWSDLADRADGDRRENERSERAARSGPTSAHSVPRTGLKIGRFARMVSGGIDREDWLRRGAP